VELLTVMAVSEQVPVAVAVAVLAQEPTSLATDPARRWSTTTVSLHPTEVFACPPTSHPPPPCRQTTSMPGWAWRPSFGNADHRDLQLVCILRRYR